MADTASDAPPLASPVRDFVEQAALRPETHPHELVAPYKDYESHLRKLFAQQPRHPAVTDPLANVTPIFTGHEKALKVHARNPRAESQEQRDKYMMALGEEARRPSGSAAVVQSLKEFQTNFSVFSESSLADLDWDNVVAAGSSVVTPLMPVPDDYAESKRTLRSFYHDKVARASDVDLFLYGLTEQQATEKLKRMERNVRDAILGETTTVRSKNAITIVSRYPTRHVQIVLRVYKSISEILTGFDVDCACACYDGRQVYASPRALASYMTQTNTIDLSRRSPSYENRLSKYAKRGFEIYWPALDRSRIDPTIYERGFSRVVGLARLLVLEKLPDQRDRDRYLDERRAERGRPAADRSSRYAREFPGNIKEHAVDEVPEWDEGPENDVADYHTFTIPYGPSITVKKVEKLLYTKDLLLNAEWNRPKGRQVELHRHPTFFGFAEDVVGDCCGYCPIPKTDEEKEVAEQESKAFISGPMMFMRDDPGRQSIGSFNPITTDDWTDMAYVTNIGKLCEAINARDLAFVKRWCSQEGNDPNTRDWTGRCPLHLAVINSSPDIVQCLIEHGARLVARLVDGSTTIHLATKRGSQEGLEILRLILAKSEANEEVEAEKEASRRATRKSPQQKDGTASGLNADERGSAENEDVEMIENGESDTVMDTASEGSLVEVEERKPTSQTDSLLDDSLADEPDVFNVDVYSWDVPVTALHLAIVCGHETFVKELVQSYAADVLTPIKQCGGILTLHLAQRLQSEQAHRMTALLLKLGATCLQADQSYCTAFHAYVAAGSPDIATLFEHDEVAAQKGVNYLLVQPHYGTPDTVSPLTTSILNRDLGTACTLIDRGAKKEVHFKDFIASYLSRSERAKEQSSKENKEQYLRGTEQPIISAVRSEVLQIASTLAHGPIDVNVLTLRAYVALTLTRSRDRREAHESLLDIIQKRKAQLQQYTGKPRAPELPKPLKDDDYYLRTVSVDSYEFFRTTYDFELEKKTRSAELDRRQKEFEKARNRLGLEEKKKIIQESSNALDRLEHLVLSKGAKSFYELHPEVEIPKQQEESKENRERKDAGFEITLDFRAPNLTETTRSAYVKLFGAAWSGDLDTIKSLTLAPWSPDEEPPLSIAIEDTCGLTPFSIAVLRGHFELAKILLQICEVQRYSTKVGDGDEARRRYRVASEDEQNNDANDNADDDRLPISSELVDEKFTVDVMENLSNEVKGNMSPGSFLLCGSEPRVLLGILATAYATGDGHDRNIARDLQALQIALQEDKDEGVGARLGATLRAVKAAKSTLWGSDLLLFAIAVDQVDIVDFMLDLRLKHKFREDGKVELSRPFAFEFTLAVRFGKLTVLPKLIERAGAGTSFTALLARSGVKVPDRSKPYYKGLSIHGRKREGWARRIRENLGNELAPASPVLQSIFEGNLECVKWFLSDAPLRHYMEFVNANMHDERLQSLSAAPGGIEGQIKGWLSRYSELALHCAVMAKPTRSSLQIVKHLVSLRPYILDVKSPSGHTPLHLAFSLHRLGAARALAEAGANQTCRDKSGQNILHALLDRLRIRPTGDSTIASFRAFISLVDRRVLPSLFTERASDAHGQFNITPLAKWLANEHAHRNAKATEFALKVLAILLDASSGEDLEMIDGAGHLPLHTAVKKQLAGHAALMIRRNSALLHRENATGTTPYEMAADAWLRRQLTEPPPRVEAPRSEMTVSSEWGETDGWSVLHEPPESFVEKAEDEQEEEQASQKRKMQEELDGLAEVVWDDGVGWQERTWRVCQRAVEMEEEREGPGRWRLKRRLVSLFEANAVSERLAGKERAIRAGMARGRPKEESDGERLEVEFWYDGWLSQAERFDDGEDDVDGDD